MYISSNPKLRTRHKMRRKHEWLANAIHTFAFLYLVSCTLHRNRQIKVYWQRGEIVFLQQFICVVKKVLITSLKRNSIFIIAHHKFLQKQTDWNSLFCFVYVWYYFDNAFKTFCWYTVSKGRDSQHNWPLRGQSFIGHSSLWFSRLPPWATCTAIATCCFRNGSSS